MGAVYGGFDSRIRSNANIGRLSKPIFMQDKSKKVHEGLMNLDSALHSVGEASYNLGAESTALPESVFRHMSAARNSIEQAMDAIQTTPVGKLPFDLSSALYDANVHEGLMAENNQNNLRITRQAEEMVKQVTEDLNAMFAQHGLNISVSSEFHEIDDKTRDNYCHIYVISCSCKNGYSYNLVRIMLVGANKYALGNGRFAKRHREVFLKHSCTTYSSLNDLLQAHQDKLTTLIINSRK